MHWLMVAATALFTHAAMPPRHAFDAMRRCVCAVHWRCVRMVLDSHRRRVVSVRRCLVLQPMPARRGVDWSGGAKVEADAQGRR